MSNHRNGTAAHDQEEESSYSEEELDVLDVLAEGGSSGEPLGSPPENLSALVARTVSSSPDRKRSAECATPEGMLSYAALLESFKKQKQENAELRQAIRMRDEMLREAASTTGSLSQQVTTLRNDASRAGTVIAQLEQGLRPDAPKADEKPTYVDNGDGSMVPCDFDIRRLALAMANDSKNATQRSVMSKLLRLPDVRDRQAPPGFSQRSPKDLFDRNEYKLDMWGAVAKDGAVFDKLWEYCVHPRYEAKRVLPKRHEAPPVRRIAELGDSIGWKATGTGREAMPWFDSRDDAPTEQTGLRPPWRKRTAPVPVPEAPSTSLTPSLQAWSLACPPARAPVPKASPKKKKPPPPDSDSEEEAAAVEAEVLFAQHAGPTPMASPAAQPSLLPTAPPAPALAPSAAPRVELAEGVTEADLWGDDDSMTFDEPLLRPPDAQYTDVLAAPVEDDGFADDEPCAVCNKRGVVTACDGDCGKFFHWHCVYPEHDGDTAKWYCKACAPKHPEWQPKPHCLKKEHCRICMTDKPANQFAELLPACPCREKAGAHVCSLCVHQIMDTATSYDQLKCPFCQMPKTLLKRHHGKSVDLVHKKDADGGMDRWVQVERAEPVLPDPAAVAAAAAQEEDDAQNAVRRARGTAQAREERANRRSGTGANLSSDSEGEWTGLPPLRGRLS